MHFNETPNLGNIQPSPGSCLLYSHGGASPISRFAANPSRGPGPVSRSRRPNRKTGGIPSPFPGQIGNRGNGNWGFPGGSQWGPALSDTGMQAR
jgi:hypothetical protein